MARTPKPDDFQPTPDFPKDHTHYGKPRCQAWSNNQGRQCLGIAISGTDKCRVHGGKSPKGLASPNWETGRWSAHVPTGLADKYKKAMSDPELLDRAADIALVDARIAELVEGLGDVEEGGGTWDQALKEFQDLDTALAEGDVDKAEEALDSLRPILRSGYSKETQWDKIHSALMRRNRLAGSQENRLVKMQVMIAMEDQLMIIERLASIVRDAVRQYVTDRDLQQRVLERVSKELRQLLRGEIG